LLTLKIEDIVLLFHFLDQLKIQPNTAPDDTIPLVTI